jgi:hypothetical protein
MTRGRYRQETVTELRSLGDSKTMVVYTNENRVYKNLQESVKPLKVVLYEQEQEGKIATVGADLYFPASCRKLLEKLLET